MATWRIERNVQSDLDAVRFRCVEMWQCVVIFKGLQLQVQH